MKPCPRCNHAAQEDQTECPNCGVVFAQWNATHPSSSTPVSPLERARTAAWIVMLGSIAGIFFLPTGWDRFRVILFLVLMLDVIVIAVLRSWIRKRLAATLSPTKDIPERSLKFVVIVTLAGAMLDAFYFGQGVISVILCIAGVLRFLPRAIAARKDGARFRLRLSKAAITSVAGFAALGMIAYNNVIARERAEILIVAVEQFHTKYGRYPERLKEVVPVFIAEIPNAKYVWIEHEFTYGVWVATIRGRRREVLSESRMREICMSGSMRGMWKRSYGKVI